MFSESLHFVCGFGSLETPLPEGPRQSGQFSARAVKGTDMCRKNKKKKYRMARFIILSLVRISRRIETQRREAHQVSQRTLISINLKFISCDPVNLVNPVKKNLSRFFLCENF